MSDFVVVSGEAFASALQAEAAERLARLTVQLHRVLQLEMNPRISGEELDDLYDLEDSLSERHRAALAAYAAFVPEE